MSNSILSKTYVAWLFAAGSCLGSLFISTHWANETRTAQRSVSANQTEVYAEVEVMHTELVIAEATRHEARLQAYVAETNMRRALVRLAPYKTSLGEANRKLDNANAALTRAAREEDKHKRDLLELGYVDIAGGGPKVFDPLHRGIEVQLLLYVELQKRLPYEINETLQFDIMPRAPLRSQRLDWQYSHPKWSSDEQWLAVASNNRDSEQYTAYILDTATKRELHKFTHPTSISELHWGVGDKTLLVVGSDRTIQLWDVEAQSILQSWKFEESWAWYGRREKVNWNLSHNLLLINLKEETIVVDTVSGSEVFTIPSDVAAWSPDRHYLAYTTEENVVEIWSASKKQIQTKLSHDKKIASVVWHPNNKELLVIERTYQSVAHVWDLPSQTKRLQFSIAADIGLASWSPDGEYIAAGHDTVSIYDTNTGIQVFQLEPDNINYAIEVPWIKPLWSNDSRHLLVSNGFSLNLWDIDQFKKVDFIAVDGVRTSIAWSADNQKIIVDGYANEVTIIELPLPSPEMQFPEQVLAADLHNTQLLTVDINQQVAVWNVETGAKMHTFNLPNLYNKVAWNADGTLFMGANVDHTKLDFVNAQTGEIIEHYRVDKPFAEIAWSNSEGNVITLFWENIDERYAYDILTGDLQRVESTNDNGSPYTLSRFGQISSTGQNALSPGFVEGGIVDVFSVDEGRRLYVITHDKKLIKYIVDLDLLIEEACKHITRNLTQAEWQDYFPDDPYQVTCTDLPYGT